MAFFSQNGQVPMEKHPLPPKEETRGKYVFKISFFSLRSPDHFLSFLAILEYFGIFSFWS